MPSSLEYVADRIGFGRTANKRTSTAPHLDPEGTSGDSGRIAAEGAGKRGGEGGIRG
jgi:hypothetical protein